MNKTSIFKRMLISVLAIAMVLTAIPMTTVTAQAAPTAIKKVVIKQGKKNVTKKTIKLAAGKSTKIKVTVTPSSAKKSIKYVSGNKKVATVSKSGKIKAKAAGTTKIKVTVTGKNKKKKTAWVKVKVTGVPTEDTPSPQPSNSPAPSQAPAPQPSVAPTPQPAPAMVNGSVQLPITNAVSSDPTIATVDATGKVTAGAKAGTVTITGKDASGNDVSYTVTVTNEDVAAAVVASSKVKVNIAKTDLVVGESIVATTDVTPAGDSVVWASSDSSIATVDANGQIVAVSAGSARITATSSRGASDSVTITVKAIAVTGIEIDGPSEISLVTSSNSKTTLKANVLPANATERRINFTTSKEGIVTVDAQGVVEAKAKGEVEVYATTVDGGFKATWKIKVDEKTNEDVDTMSMTVSNAIDGHENTVLTGTRMAIAIEVGKDGQSVGGDINTVTLDLQPISGYTNMYSLVEDVVKLDSNGKGTAFIKYVGDKESEHGYTYDALIEDTKNYEDAAYASYKLEATAGGASLTQSINVTFAQVLVETEYSEAGTALTVNNDKEPLTDPLEKTSGALSTNVTTNNDGFKTEYVVSQQVTPKDSSGGNSHKIELDASPLLIIPATEDDENRGVYDKNYGYTSGKFSVYSSFENAYTIPNVPGGLTYLTLTLNNLSLSPYTKLVVRCYDKDTNFPIEVDGKYLEEVISYKTNLQKGQTITFGDKVFGLLKDRDFIDVKVFVESAGQVNNDQRGGFTLEKGYGKYANKTYKEYSIERMPECVEWEVEPSSMSAAVPLDNPKAYLGQAYNKAYTYEYSLPTGEMTGNAIIYVSDANADEKNFVYMYPTKQDNHKNVLDDNGSAYLLTVSKEEVTPLEEGQFTAERDADGNYIINSYKAGFVNVKATVKLPTGNASKIGKYEVFSSVQWCPIPKSSVASVEEEYAVAGETVTLTAVVKDMNDNVVTSDQVTDADGKLKVTVDWLIDGISTSKMKNDEDITADVAIIDKDAYEMDKNGEVKLQLRGKKHLDISNIVAELSGRSSDTKNYDLEWYVDGKKVTDDYVDIHWVKPGMYYENSALADDDEYYTNLETENVTVDQNEYVASENWLLGVKVVGTKKELDENEEEVLVASKDITISNIKVGIQNANEGTDVTVDKTMGNGVFGLSNSKIGKSTETLGLEGYIDPSARCVITVDGVPHTSVGELMGESAFIAGVKLIIPVQWSPNGQVLSFYTPSGAVFNVTNEVDPVLYLKVVDKTEYANPVEGAKVSYTLFDEANKPILVKKDAETDKNGLIEIVLDAKHRPTINMGSQEAWLLTASINNGTDIQQTITFNPISQDAFTLLDVNPVETDGKNSTVKISFSKNINKDNLNKGMFKLYDGKNPIDIESMDVDDTNAANILIIKTKRIFSDEAFSYEIKPVVIDDNTGVTYQLLDKEGRLFTSTDTNDTLDDHVDVDVDVDGTASDEDECEDLEEIEF